MAHLTLAGVSDDGGRLLLVDDRGEEFTLEITRGLRAALRGETARLGQLEITMDSALRPRDIQARIRAGEAPETVAQLAQTTVERIMPFVGPVLAERQHVAERAQRSSLRRSAGESGTRTLGEAVEGHLRAANVDPAAVTWDAWKREDGRWSLAAQFDTPDRRGTARFTFDPPGNFVVLEDDDARWLVGDRPADPAPTASRDDLQQARRRRLAAVDAPASEQLSLGDDALELTRDVTADSDTVAGQPTVEEPVATAPGADDAAGSGQASETTAADEEPEQPPARRSVSKRRGRASVPSWDEIMFGGNDQ